MHRPVSAIQGEGDIENVGCQIPAEKVAERNTVKSSSISPNSCPVNGRPVRLHREIPSKHHEASKRWHKEKARSCEPAGAMSADQETHYPRAVTDPQICQDEQDGELEQFRPHDSRKVVMSKWETGS